MTGILSFTMITPAFAGADNFFGVGAILSDVDTVQEVMDVAENIEDAGYTPITVTSKLSSSNITASRLNSGVVYLAGHGPYDGTYVSWDSNGEDYRVCGYFIDPTKGRNIRDISLSNCKLAILAACYSGLTNGIAKNFQTSGADCSIGWTDEVDNGTLAAYTRHLTEHLATGMTIQNAIKISNVSVLEDLPRDYDDRIFKYKTYGSGVYNPIKRNRSVSENMASDAYEGIMSTYTYLENEIVEYKDGNDMQIVSYIQKNVDPLFDENLFKVITVETIPGDDSDMMIAYRYRIGDAVSDFGYNVNIEDHKMVSYKAVGNPLYDIAIPAIEIDDIKNEKLNTFNQTNSDEALVKNQDIDVVFNSGTKQFEYYVNTTYETQAGGIYVLREKY